MLYKFNEILNDLMDYFILGDPEYLLQYKKENNLPDDLLTEFTTETTGDEAVKQGAIIPMCGIEDLPYTIYFNLSGETPELFKGENLIQHRKDGYCLKVVSGEIYLYTIPYLGDYTKNMVDQLKKARNAKIEISNGWYSVSILAGFSQQYFEIDKNNIEISIDDTRQLNRSENIFNKLEPTFEFVIKPSNEKPKFTGDFLYKFKIKLDNSMEK